MHIKLIVAALVALVSYVGFSDAFGGGGGGVRVYQQHDKDVDAMNKVDIESDTANTRTLEIASYDDVNTYLHLVCWPTDTVTGEPNNDAPCNAMEALTYQCINGPALPEFTFIHPNATNGTNTTATVATADIPVLKLKQDMTEAPLFSNLTQRNCYCSSEYFHNMMRCGDCMRAHGGGDPQYGALPVANIASLSSSYCLAAYTPTLQLVDMLGEWAVATSEQPMLDSPATLTEFSDPIGPYTAVKSYYTPQVTGTALYAMANFVNASGNDSASYSAQLRTNYAGIIVPTMDTGALTETVVTPTATTNWESSAAAVKVVEKAVCLSVAALSALAMLM